MHSAFSILLIEDNPGDIRLIQEAAKDCQLSGQMTVVKDGQAAMAFLQATGDGSKPTYPDLILLDLNLPGKNGLEVLKEIKSASDLRRIPVVILSSSESPQDIATAYERHANCYVTKPSDIDRYIEAIDAIYRFWLTIAELPQKDGRT